MEVIYLAKEISHFLMRKFYRKSKFNNITGIVVCVVAVITSCSHQAKANPTLLESYYEAIEDAKNPESDEISKDLTAITKSNQNLFWDGKPGESRVLVATLTNYDGYKLGQEEPQTIDIWVTVYPELKNFCSQYQSLREGNLELRLKQLLGLSPNWEYDKVVEMWIDPRYIFRPSKDPEISDSEAELEYPESEAFITISLEHKEWFEARKKKSYSQNNSNGKYNDNAQPWTQLGYTYDWGNSKSEIGLSEFVIKEGSPVKVESISSIENYCLKTTDTPLPENIGMVTTIPPVNGEGNTQNTISNQVPLGGAIVPVVVSIAVSLFCIYILFSLLVSTVQENIAAIFQWRAKHLKQSIIDILDWGDESRKITKLLYENPLISSLNQSGNRRFIVDYLIPPSFGPSYISSNMFSAALLRVLELEFGLNSNDLNQITDQLSQTLQIQQSEIRKGTGIGSESSNGLESLPSELVEILLSLARQARYRFPKEQSPGIQEFQQEISKWFNESQERSIGVYKRNALGSILLISLLVAVSFNIDTINIVQQLYNNSELTQTVSGLATHQVNSINARCNTDPNPSQCIEKELNETSVEEIVQQIRSFPVGWRIQQRSINFQFQQSFYSAVLGWLLSAVALSQGAPFWFDLLNKFINIRNSGSQTIQESEKGKYRKK